MPGKWKIRQTFHFSDTYRRRCALSIRYGLGPITEV